jgi:intracellular multiplication protein IcmB
VIGTLSKMLAALSLMLRQPLYSYCDVETTHGDALVTKHGDYVSILRVDGMRRMATRQDVARIATAQRVDLTGSLESKGHAIVGWFASDPERSAVEIDRLNLHSCRAVAREVAMNLSDILDERARLWPQIMRWEAAYYVLWTRKAVLTKEERKQAKEEQDDLAKEWNRVGDSQRFYLRSEIMAARHAAFVARVAGSLHNVDVAAVGLDAHAALKVIRESLYRETAGSAWKATLLGDRVMPRLSEEDEKPHPEGLLWPSIRSQIFHADAITHGGQRVQIGDYEYAPVDMVIGPEDPRPFVELSSALGKDRIPWRGAVLIEGGGKAMMAMKEIGASFLAMFPSNGDLRRAFAALQSERDQNNHISVKMRVSFATWASVEDNRKLRRRASTLSQRIEGWGNCKATSVCGDPLEGAMSSVPGLSLTSTGTASLALLTDALFRRPDGAIWPYDPAGGSMRPLVLDIFVAPPGSGKSVLANTINLGLCLSTAVMGSKGAKLPLIGKADIGPSAQGFVRLIQEALVFCPTNTD